MKLKQEDLIEVQRDVGRSSWQWENDKILITVEKLVNYQVSVMKKIKDGVEFKDYEIVVGWDNVLGVANRFIKKYGI